jgi:phosphatidylglycerol:prolipoprotein diacylglycerol transferase
MIPVLFEIGPLRVYSYGLMLGIAFLVGSYVLGREFRRKGIDANHASTITIISVVFGLVGAKVLHLLENWQAFVQDPVGMAFSAGGLTWYGGFLLAIVVAGWYAHRKRIPLLRFLDAVGIALMIGYGVGRIGCHLSGDGDYGVPTTLPWGTIYAQGTAKPSVMLERYFADNADAREFWKYDSLRVMIAGRDRLGGYYTRFDEVTPLHPTPVYEFLLGVLGFGILLALRKRPMPDGMVFAAYLLLASLFRFSVEFLRLNPRLLFGLSEAQLFSVILFLAGIAAAVVLAARSRPTTRPSG